MNGIVQAYDEEAFHNAVVTGTAPLASYSLSTLNSNQPAARVLFGVTTATVIMTLGGAFQGDVLAIPVSNATAIQLTNGSGLNVAIPIPTMTRSGVPKTIVADLTLLQANNATRTAAVWTLVFTGPANIIIGGAILLYGPVHRLIDNFLWGSASGGHKTPVNRQKTAATTESKNEYLTRYIQAHGTFEQNITLNHYEKTAASLADFESWFDGSLGGGLPSLLWPGVAANLDVMLGDAFFGTWHPMFEMRQIEAGITEVTLQFYELSKGKPVAGFAA